MSSMIESYSLCPPEELDKHLKEIEIQRQNAWELYQALCAEEQIISGVISDKISASQAVGHEAMMETIEPSLPLLSTVAA